MTELPESFGNLKSLKECFLSKNHLELLPSNFGELSNLEDLRLEHNEVGFCGCNCWKPGCQFQWVGGATDHYVCPYTRKNDDFGQPLTQCLSQDLETVWPKLRMVNFGASFISRETTICNHKHIFTSSNGWGVILKCQKKSFVCLKLAFLEIPHKIFWVSK